MFTSRAEFRTLLRQDNADLRLTELSYRLGLASEERMKNVLAKKEGTKKIIDSLKEYNLPPENINAYFNSIGSSPIDEKQKVSKIILRPNVDLFSLMKTDDGLCKLLSPFPDDTIEQAEIQVKYERYIEKENDIAQRMSQMEELMVPETFDYNKVTALSNEARQKFNRIRPRTLGQASRISGVNPSDVQILMVYMGR
jgi:tRNA uridine 5-carboxymethylaminomethyl modification enzyme